jgi:Fe-S oxidoreductase
MDGGGFEAALRERVDAMLAACTLCGKCVAACPSVAPAGIGAEDPSAVIGGVLEIIRTGEGPEASRTWAASCTLSGACIKACDEGVNPRFLLAMARLALVRHTRDADVRRRDGVLKYRAMGQQVATLSRLQLERALLERLGQGAAAVAPSTLPEFVFYTGCNVLKTPHIALLALDIMDALGISYQVMGGPSHCCGVMQMRAGDVAASARLGASSIEKLSRSRSGRVLSWCPSCYVQFTETTLPTLERQTGGRPFEMVPFLLFLRDRLDDLARRFQRPLELRVALHAHPGVAGVVDAARAILCALPGVELVDLHQPAVGLQSVSLAALPAFKRALQRSELDAACAAGVDALVAVYHSDHRELCAHERDLPLRIVNILELVGEAMGLHRHDRYKELKILQDAEVILAECRELIEEHALNSEAARDIVRAMIADQPLPLGTTRALPGQDPVASAAAADAPPS